MQNPEPGDSTEKEAANRYRTLPFLAMLTLVLWVGLYVLAEHTEPHGPELCPKTCDTQEENTPSP